MNDEQYKRIPEALKREAVKSCLKFEESFPNKWCGDVNQIEMIKNTGSKIQEAIKPKKTPVDMSVLIDSGIDCIFHNAEGEFIDILSRIDGSWFISEDCHGNLCTEFLQCKPRMNYWFSACNFIDVDQLIDNIVESGFRVCTIRNDDGGIEAFKILGVNVAEDRCWPWENRDE